MQSTKLLGVLALSGVIGLAGCAEVPKAKWQQSTPLCVAAGAVAGGAGAAAADSEAAAGALVGAGIAYLFCHKETVCKADEVRVGQSCELDSDRDGIINADDQCPSTVPYAKVNAQGCELDSDNDGVVNRLDQCPDTVEGAVVNAFGCANDEDKDGVPNEMDLCPNSVVGRAVDQNGCEPEKEMTLNGVEFEYKSSDLTAQAKLRLNDTVQTLKANSFSYEVQGHTDSVASDEYNRRLSKSRAESVKNYLVSQGIDASRLTAVGLGEAKPVASNATEAGRAQNRRVVLVLK